jgi:hypothetical protein
MTVALWCLCLAASPGAADSGAVTLLADDPAYQKARGGEAVFEGVLERNPGGKLGAGGRFNIYRLALEESGKPMARDLYLPGNGAALALHVGKRVRVVGKLIETEDDGKKYLEIWPARLEIASGALPSAPGPDGVFARCGWQPPDAQRLGKREYVFRDGEALARAMRLTGTSAAEGATSQLAKQLHVPAVDWSKHMAVSVCAGLSSGGMQLKVTRAAVVDGTLVVSYRLEAPDPSPGGFGYPAETVLLARFDGPVKVEVDKGKEADRK